VPETGTPLAVSASLVAGSGLAVLRKTTGDVPTRRRALIGTSEGAAKFVLVDDVMASGVSKMRCIGQLSAEVLPVAGIVVVVNRRQGGDHLLAKLGYPVKHLLDIHELMDVLVAQGKIGRDTRDQVQSYLASRQYSMEEFTSLLEGDPAVRAALDRGALGPLRRAVPGRF
jgi:orotate phosphoribosyltransferase